LLKNPQEQLSQRLGKVSIFGDIQNTSGQGPQQPAQVDPPQIKGFELEVPSSLNYLGILQNASFKFL